MKKKRRQKTATIHSLAPLNLRNLLLACLIFFLFQIGTVQAQHRRVAADYALIFGTVWGPDDRPVDGITVKIRRAEDRKARWEVYSNRLGEFEQRVPVGRRDYVIWADLRGYKSLKYKHLRPGPEVTVHIESNERVDTGLHLK